MVLRWIFSDKPESPELMATRITNVRRLSMSSMLFGLDSRIYDITDPTTIRHMSRTSTPAS